MDFSPEEERAGIHSALNLHTKRIVTAFYSIVECSQVGRRPAAPSPRPAGDDPRLPDSHRNRQLPAEAPQRQPGTFAAPAHDPVQLHSCRNLHIIASDLVINALLHSPDPNLRERVQAEATLAEGLSSMRQRISEFERVLRPVAGSTAPAKSNPSPKNK
ncbi:enoyl-ACP reductase, putative [Babesia caballi]|uniref:Enoyl-ACP reductase, putative n=1 Tax=Babesia caballi TaxID=5871 RepID=A0AAV4LYF8_BABCB|nr:enoyl-ACP reductase, putative [Babesia caballi]